MGWATAWSFDRLRLWCERGTTPGLALARAIGESALRALLCAAALVYAPPVAALFVLAAALLLPPLPGTPAARRCLRTPPGRTSATAPRLLSTLEPS